MFAWTDQNNKKSKKSIPIRKQYIAKQTATFNKKKGNGRDCLISVGGWVVHCEQRVEHCGSSGCVSCHVAQHELRWLWVTD